MLTRITWPYYGLRCQLIEKLDLRFYLWLSLYINFLKTLWFYSINATTGLEFKCRARESFVRKATSVGYSFFSVVVVFFSFFRQPPFPALRTFGLPELSWPSDLLVGFRSSEKRVREAVNCLQLSRVTSLSGASCVDKSPSCGYWALIGECTKNPGYMLTSCCVWCNHMKSMYSENEMHLLNYYKTARFCVVSYTAGSLLLFGVTQRQERCVASLE